MIIAVLLLQDYSGTSSRVINQHVYPGADPGFGVGGKKFGKVRVLLLLSRMFMERMMQEI